MSHTYTQNYYHSTHRSLKTEHINTQTSVCVTQNSTSHIKCQNDNTVFGAEICRVKPGRFDAEKKTVFAVEFGKQK